MNIQIELKRLLKSLPIFTLIIIFLFVTFQNINNYIVLLSAIILIFFSGILIFSKDVLNPFMLMLLVNGLGTLDVLVVALELREPRFPVDTIYIIQALILINLWHFMLLIGFYFGKKISLSNKKSDNNFKKIFFNKKIVLTIVLLFLIYGVFEMLRVSSSFGGLLWAMQNRGTAYNGLSYLPLVIGLAGIVPVLLYDSKKNKLAMLSLAFVFFLQSLLGGRTTAIFTSILPLLFYYNYKVKKINKKKIYISIIPLILFLVFWGQIRMLGEINSGMNLSEILINLTKDKNYGQNLPYLIYSLDTKKINYQFFDLMLNIFFAFIPRKLWLNKPNIDQSGIIGRMMYGPKSTGQPVGPYGFAYISFGWLGVIIFAILTGFIISKVHGYVSKKNSLEAYLWYSYVSVKLYNVMQPSAQLEIIWFSSWFILFVLLSNLMSTKSSKIKMRIS